MIITFYFDRNLNAKMVFKNQEKDKGLPMVLNIKIFFDRKNTNRILDFPQMLYY